MRATDRSERHQRGGKHGGGGEKVSQEKTA